MEGAPVALVGVCTFAVGAWASRRLPGLLAARSRLAVGLVTAAAALGAVAGPGAATGLVPFDALLRGLLAALVTLASARARRWAWAAASALAAVASLGHGWAWLAFAALGLATATAVSDRRGPVTGALVGAAAVQVLLRLPVTSPVGLSSAVAASAITALLVSAARLTRRRHLRLLAEAVGGLGLLVVVVGVAYGLAVSQARPQAQQGISSADASLAAAVNGESATAGADLSAAAADFAAAHRQLTPWWARAARLVPVLGQNARALEGLTAQGSEVTSGAAALARAGGAGALRFRDGALDLAAVQRMGRAASASLASLLRARAALADLRSPWLLPPLASRIDGSRAQIDRVATDERTLVGAARQLPPLLGFDGPRRYFVAIQDPVEQRGSGGFMADYLVLGADHGRLHVSNLEPVPPAPRSGPLPQLTGLPASWARNEAFAPQRYFGDATFAPDFPTVAQAIEQLYPQVGGTPVDGVISVDPLALAALLRLTGPVTVPGWPTPLSATDAGAVLLHEQYLHLAGPRRQDFLAETASGVLSRIAAGGLPSPGAVARALGPAVRAGHLMAYSNQPVSERLFRTIGAAGAMPGVHGDFLEVVTQNASASKIDWYLRRSISDHVTYQPGTGAVDVHLVVTLINTAPSTGQPRYVIGGGPGAPVAPGVNQLYLSVYTPLQFLGGTAGGQALPMSSQIELGRNVYSQLLQIPPGGALTVRLHLSGHVAPGDRYHLDLAHQPTIFPDQVEASVRAPAPWQPHASYGTVSHRTWSDSEAQSHTYGPITVSFTR